MVQEILSHGGDVLNFSGDAILSMWKKLPSLSFQCVVHAAIDCGLSVQKNYGTYHTEAGVVLKVKVAISAGLAHFALIGDATHSHYVILGQPVWDVKVAEYLAVAGDVMTSSSAWMYANAVEYGTEPFGDGRHTKVLQAKVSWKKFGHNFYRDKDQPTQTIDTTADLENYYKEFSLRPVIVSALRSSWWPTLRKFMVQPVIWAVENDEPMEFLTEIRRVVIVFLNVITKTVTDEFLVCIVDRAFKCVFSISSASGGLLNKVSMFDKDLMFLLVFGLRGMTHGDEARKSLLCAQAIKESLVDPNIISISIGISSGTTYCGVVGHVLRREYTVIGTAVNKAARLMTAYPNKVVCDKETYLRSKMGQEFFQLKEFKPLKGILNPGPVYEFNQYGWPERPVGRRQPILGRDEELKVYILTLQKALMQQHQSFTRYRDHVYGVVFLGPSLVGKTRLMEECIRLTPNCIRIVRISLVEKDKVPYGLFRQIALKTLTGISRGRNKCENKIRTSVDIDAMTPVQLYAMNVMFGCRFAVPENLKLPEDILGEYSVKNVVREIFQDNISSLCIVAIEEALYADDESWKLVLLLLDTKTIFVIMNIKDHGNMSDVARRCLSNNMLLKMPLSGLSHQYHSVIACQFLDVQAIPADLEKLIQSASDGMPGWIQNFMISLVQHGDLSVATMTRSQALERGAVVPAQFLLYKSEDLSAEIYNQDSLDDEYFKGVLERLDAPENDKSKSIPRLAPQGNDQIQIAVLSDTFEVLNVNISMDIDAVAKLFSIHVLECEGGDFTQHTSKVLVHPAPEVHDALSPYCSCLGTKFLSDCADLPKYAFCGYMRFKHPLFRKITYELLTETQKYDMHARALLYLEHYTRRCWYCGEGCFHKMMGNRTNDGLLTESAELKNTQQLIRSFAEETHHTAGEAKCPMDSVFRPSLPLQMLSGRKFRLPGQVRESLGEPKAGQRVRSFSSLDVANCQCLAISLFVYCQLIEHCHGAGEHEKLFEAYLEYADLCVMNSNIPQAFRLLNEAETFVMSNNYWNQLNCKIGWLKEFYLGRIVSLRGGCMLDSGELIEAKKHLYRAMELFRDPFPTTKYRKKIRNMQTSVRQWMALKATHNEKFVGTESGLVGIFYEEVAVTLNRLYRLFTERKENSNAKLASKWSFEYAIRSNSNFQLLCESYGNMITTCLNNQEFSKCVKLEKQAMDLCRRKRGQLDDAEARAVCVLYSSVFLFYVEYGRKTESLEFGLPVMYMASKLREPALKVRLVVCVLRLLLSDLRIAEMVLLMRESLYLGEQYDLSSTTWYYSHSMVILIETGYCVESYQECERYYMKNGDTILRCKSKDAAWMYFACMWLITVRVSAWERSVIWEKKVKEIISVEKAQIEYKLYLQLILLEGLLIMLVREIDVMNMNKVAVLKDNIKIMFESLKKCCRRAPIYLPRYYLLLAYFCFMRGKKFYARNYLEKTFVLAKDFSEGTILIWAEHTRQHWTGTLDPTLEDFWTEHIEPDNLLDYRDFSEHKGFIPYTLPLPKELER